MLHGVALELTNAKQIKGPPLTELVKCGARNILGQALLLDHCGVVARQIDIRRPHAAITATATAIARARGSIQKKR